MKKVNLVLVKSFITNISIVIIKTIIGFAGHSNAMIADAIHSFSDFTTDLICILGNKVSGKKADDKHPFGYGKIEYLTSTFIGLVVLVLGLSMLFKAVYSGISKPTDIVLYVSIVLIGVKYILARYISKKGYEYKNSILIASGIESGADCLTSFFVVISVLLSKLTKYNSIFKYSDRLCTLLIGLYIIYTAYKILKDNFINLIGKNEEDPECLLKIRKIINQNIEIKEILNLNLLKYGSYYVADLEIGLAPNTTLDEIEKIITKLKKQLCNRRINISYIKISVKEMQ